MSLKMEKSFVAVSVALGLSLPTVGFGASAVDDDIILINGDELLMNGLNVFNSLEDEE